jgi:hypothetical protein
LCGQENIGLTLSELFSQADAAQKAAFFTTDRNDFRAQASDQSNSLLAHPVGHEDDDLMAQRPPDRGKGNARVAAGGFDDRISRVYSPLSVCLFQDMKGHPVLDAAGHVEVLGLGVDDALFSSEREPNGKQWRVADHMLQLVEACRCLADQRLRRQQGIGALDCDLALHKDDEATRLTQVLLTNPP